MTTLTREQLRTERHWQYLVAAVVGGVLLAYSGLGGLGGIIGIVEQWLKPPYDYVHGFAVVPFAVYLLWKFRDKLPEKVAWPNWGGLLLLLGPLPLYLADADLNMGKEWVQGGCLVTSLAGVIVTFVSPPPTRPRGPIDLAAGVSCLTPVLYLVYFKLGGTSKPVFGFAVGWFALGVAVTLFRRWSAVRWAMPALAMLLLSLPLPNFVENEVSWQLRKVATAAAMGVFRTLGIPSRAETPTVLDVGTERLAVQEACSGLSMLLGFVALTAAVAFLCPPTRRLTDRWAVVASSVPIAVFCNILRIVACGLMLLAGWREAYKLIAHDLAGLVMILLSLGLVWLEFKLIDWLLVPVIRMSREEVVRAGIAEARAEIERQETTKRVSTSPHPAAPFLPLTPAGTSHGATATGGTINPRPTGDKPPPGAKP